MSQVPVPAMLILAFALLNACRGGTVKEPDVSGTATEGAPKGPGAASMGDKEKTAMDEVSEKYYSLMSETETFENRRADRAKKAIREKTFPNPGIATGRIIDRSGRPVSNASIVVYAQNEDTELGRAATDDEGQFNISLPATAAGGLDLTVEAEGYARWAAAGIYGGIVDYRIQLDRPVDDELVTSLLAASDPEERLWMLLEITGPRQFDLELKDIFPYIGVLRQDLRALILSRAFEEGKDSPAKKAREILFYWFDTADDPLVEPGPAGRTIPEEVLGKTIGEAAWKWSKVHFASEKIQGRPPPYAFDPPVLDPENRHALVEFTVRCTHRGYNQILILNREGDQWKIMFVRDHMHWSYD